MSDAEPYNMCIEVPQGYLLLSFQMHNGLSSATLFDAGTKPAFRCKQAVSQARNQHFSALPPVSGHMQWMRRRGIADA